MVQKYKKKPAVIEAIQNKGDNWREIAEWAHEGMPPEANSIIIPQPFLSLSVRTLEGNMIANLNDWIIRGVNGEFYPCKPDIFEKTYEKVLD